MPFFPSLPADAGVRDIYRLNPDAATGWKQFSEAVMRGPSPLAPAERELIAAYVSGLNSCAYCYGGHSGAAIAFGVDTKVFDKLMEDIELAPVPESLKPILRFVRKLTLTPHKMVQADADAVFAVGWDEKTLHDAILVCARFNFMNRLVMGHGLSDDSAKFNERGERLKNSNYGQKNEGR